MSNDQVRIIELEAVLVIIRDIYLPRLEQVCREPDKVICWIGTVQYEMARTIPKIKFPEVRL